MVLKAQDTGDPGSAQALGWLCSRYWYPIYAQVRRAGHRPEDSGDLVQGFFAQLLEKRAFKVARPERGRFRAFLKTSLVHYLANQRDHDRALKRGGGHAVFSLDLEQAEQRFRLEPREVRTPETLFERRWACHVLENVLQQMREETPEAGRPLFDHIVRCLTGDGAPYARIAGDLGTTEAAVKMAVHRARKRFGTLLRAEIARTIDNPQDVNDEIRFLFSALEG